MAGLTFMEAELYQGGASKQRVQHSSMSTVSAVATVFACLKASSAHAPPGGRGGREGGGGFTEAQVRPTDVDPIFYCSMAANVHIWERQDWCTILLDMCWKNGHCS